VAGTAGRALGERPRAVAALTKRPEVFALGINIAGIWDFEQCMTWIAGRQPGRPSTFERRLGGPRGEANAEVYRQASPCNFADGLRAPRSNSAGQGLGS
jgi:hypothetical protein